ncbi:unnamed protein product, partial [Choristocarpus tenellus]
MLMRHERLTGQSNASHQEKNPFLGQSSYCKVTTGANPSVAVGGGVGAAALLNVEGGTASRVGTSSKASAELVVAEVVRLWPLLNRYLRLRDVKNAVGVVRQLTPHVDDVVHQLMGSFLKCVEAEELVKRLRAEAEDIKQGHMKEVFRCQCLASQSQEEVSSLRIAFATKENEVNKAREEAEKKLTATVQELKQAEYRAKGLSKEIFCLNSEHQLMKAAATESEKTSEAQAKLASLSEEKVRAMSVQVSNAQRSDEESKALNVTLTARMTEMEMELSAAKAQVDEFTELRRAQVDAAKEASVSQEMTELRRDLEERNEKLEQLRMFNEEKDVLHVVEMGRLLSQVRESGEAKDPFLSTRKTWDTSVPGDRPPSPPSRQARPVPGRDHGILSAEGERGVKSSGLGLGYK